MNTKSKNFINGYIEGYYGRLLTWNERSRILNELKILKFNSYFYCPKEDIEHRFNWKTRYSSQWLKEFNKFCNLAAKFKINIFAGISPGLDFNFDNDKTDFEVLISKAKDLVVEGANSIVLMFDDIPNNFYTQNSTSKSEGFCHSQLANKLYLELKKPVFLVPRIYSDELIEESNDYIKHLTKNLSPQIPLFYCGEKIVAESNFPKELKNVNNYENKIIFWDNLYANDYCPRKLFVSPWFKRTNQVNVLVNLTGMIETDLFILNIISQMITDNKDARWNSLLNDFKIPKCFRKIETYFFTNNNLLDIAFKENYNDQIEACDYMLWKWKTPLSREWYPFLFGLKHDLQLLNHQLTLERVKKIQTQPLSLLIKNYFKIEDIK